MKSIGIYYESSEATGGVNRVASTLATALLDRGYKVHIISRYEGRYGRFTDDKRIAFHQLFNKFHSKYITALIEIYRLYRLVKREKIDVLISAGGIFFALAQFSDCRHIMWDHVSFWHGNRIQQYCRRLASRKAYAVVTLTADNRQAFSKIERAKAKIITINNPASWAVNCSCNVESHQIISVGYVGRQKGFDLLLEAWRKIPGEIRDDWRLIIAGDDEGDMSRLKQFLIDNKIENIDFLGFRSDVPELLIRSSIYVMSSRWEGMPMVLLEAQSVGLPIVSFDCKTGPAEILTSKCGILVEAEDTSQLAGALEKLMKDKQLREQLSAGAIDNVNRFTPEKIIVQWIKLFEAR